jgi:hypothetical protein
VTLTNSGQACNVFWQVGSSATLGTTTRFAGSILALTSITLQTGATLSGRALAQTGTVTLASSVVSVCSLAQIPPVISPAAGAGVAIPTLSEWMWTILGALLLIVGIAAIRRPAR